MELKMFVIVSFINKNGKFLANKIPTTEYSSKNFSTLQKKTNNSKNSSV